MGLTTSIYEYFYPPRQAEFNLDIIDTLKTGDIVLFSGYSLVSSLIQTASQSEWSHVGIVIKNPDFLMNKTGVQNGIFLFESDGGYQVDVDSGKIKVGVQVSNLKEKVQAYEGKIVVRKLNCSINNETMHTQLKCIYNTLYDKPYDWHPYNLIDCALENTQKWGDLLKADPRHVDSIFCSALVGYTYTNLELMNKDTEWSFLTPGYFAEIKELCLGASLGEQEIIRDEKDIKKN